jgi:hypothetical protein
VSDEKKEKPNWSLFIIVIIVFIGIIGFALFYVLLYIYGLFIIGFPLIFLSQNQVTIMQFDVSDYNQSHKIWLTGINSASDRTFLMIEGPGIGNDTGANLQNPEKQVINDYPGSFDTIVKAGGRGSLEKWWYYWDTSDIYLPPGTYTLYATSQPKDKNHLQGVPHDSVKFVKVTSSNKSSSRILDKEWDPSAKSNTNVSFSPRIDHSAVVYNNQIWIIGGHGPKQGVWSSKQDVWSSRDGINWSPVTTSVGFGQRYRHSSLVFDGRMWVIGGSDNLGELNDIWYSTDGKNWIPATRSAAFSARMNHASVVFDNKMWVIGGYDKHHGGWLNDVWYSSDGIIWNRATSSADFLRRENFPVVVFDGKMWVVGGAIECVWVNGGCPTKVNDIWYSRNGETWTKATDSAAFSARSGHTAVVHNDKIWVIGGVSSTIDPETGKLASSYKNDLWYSNDGITWAQAIQNGNLPPIDNHISISFLNKTWIIGGGRGPSIGDPTEHPGIWYSSDNKNWTEVIPKIMT